MNLPNKITIARMAMVVILIILFFFPYAAIGIDIPTIGVGIAGQGINLVYLIGFGLFLIASLSDYIDGHLARKLNQVTSFGKFMDPIADKLLVDSCLIFLLAKPIWAPEQITLVPSLVVVILVGRDLIVDALRLVAVEKGKVIAANIFGKIKTVMEMIAISCVLLNDWPFAYLGWPASVSVSVIICYASAVVSLLSGVIYLVQNIKVLKGK